MESLVITTRSFFPEKVFLRDRKCTKIEYVEKKDIDSSNWRKISLPIYLLDLFSEAGIGNIEYLLRKYNPGARLHVFFSNFIKSVTDLIIAKDGILPNIDNVYNEAMIILDSLRGLIEYDKFKEELSKHIPLRPLNNNTDDTRKYFLEDLIAGQDSPFYCYECPVNSAEYPFRSDYRCFVIRSFKRKLSPSLGKKYFASLVELFGESTDYLVHDYDLGSRLMQSSYVPNKKVPLLLFKHNKGDVYQILKEGSFSLLYLYVKNGYELKFKIQAMVTRIEKELGQIQDTDESVDQLLKKRYDDARKLYEKFKKETLLLPAMDKDSIMPSLNRLQECLGSDISDKYSLCKMMFNIMKLNDYVLWKNKTGER